jgi:hypothetical protein
MTAARRRSAADDEVPTDQLLPRDWRSDALEPDEAWMDTGGRDFS